MPTLEMVGSGGKTVVAQMDAYGAGKYALVTEGSWNTKSYWGLKGVQSAMAPTPIGPERQARQHDQRSGRQHLRRHQNPDAAWKWVRYLASADCQQNVVAKQGIVFPALTGAAARGPGGVRQGRYRCHPVPDTCQEQTTTHLAPIADHWTEIQATMTEALETYLLFKSDIGELDKANDKIDKLFQ